jgi:hypothetical protein
MNDNIIDNKKLKEIQKLITNCCYKLYRRGLLPGYLIEDAKQEAWVGYLEGVNILTHLVKWSRAEIRYNVFLEELIKPRKDKKVKFKIDVNDGSYDDMTVTGYIYLNAEPSTA